MPTTRTRRTRSLTAGRITPAAVEAFNNGDDSALRQVLGLKPWQFPSLAALDAVPLGETVGDDWIGKSQALREALEKASAEV